MSRAEKLVGFLLVVMAGIWGCAKAPEAANARKNTSLEAKAQRLEQDYRAAAAARDQLQKKLQAAEEKLAAVEAQARQLHTERDTLKGELQTLATQYESFRTNLKALIGQAERALASPGNRPTVTIGFETQDQTQSEVRN